MHTGMCQHRLNSLSFSITAGAQRDHPEGLVTRGSLCLSGCYSDMAGTRNNSSLLLNLLYMQSQRFYFLQSKIRTRCDIPSDSTYKPGTISRHHAGATRSTPSLCRAEAIRCLPQLLLSEATARIDRLPKENLRLPRGG